MDRSIIKVTCSSDTKVITDHGRKFISEVVAGEDMVLVCNSDDQKMKFVPVKEKICIPMAEQKMKRIRGTYIDICVPEDNMIYACHAKSSAVIKAKINELTVEELNRLAIPIVGYEWEGADEETFILPAVTRKNSCGKEMVYPEKKISMKAFSEFLGFYLADGSCNTSVANGRQNFTVSIKQNVRNEQYVIDLFKAIGYDPSVTRYPDNNNAYYVWDVQLWDFLHRLGGARQKHVPHDFLTLSKKYQVALMEGFIKGDSYQRSEGNYFVSSTSKRMIEDLQTIFLQVTGNLYRINTVHTKYKMMPYQYYAINLNIKNKHARNAHIKEVTEEKHSVLGYALVLETGDLILTERNGILGWCYTS